MLVHPLSWQNPGRKAKLPFDYVVSALRALGVTPAELADPPEVSEPEDAPGQPAMAMAAKPAVNAPPPLPVMADNMIARLGQPVWAPLTPAGWDEDFDVWVAPGQIAERITTARRLISRLKAKPEPDAFLASALADFARAETASLVSRAPRRETALMLALAAPEFHRR
jgi:uncharacterized protein (DUF1800 family)